MGSIWCSCYPYGFAPKIALWDSPHRANPGNANEKSCTYTIIYTYIQGEAPKIVKLVYNSNNYGLWYL